MSHVDFKEYPMSHVTIFAFSMSILKGPMSRVDFRKYFMSCRLFSFLLSLGPISILINGHVAVSHFRVKGPEQMGGAYCLCIARERFCLTSSASKIYSSSTVNPSDKSPGVLHYIYIYMRDIIQTDLMNDYTFTLSVSYTLS